jgi:hypothetical protein
VNADAVATLQPNARLFAIVDDVGERTFANARALTVVH